MDGQRTSPAPARNGSPNYPDKLGNVGGMASKPGSGEGSVRQTGRRPDEVDRSGVKTWASNRTPLVVAMGFKILTSGSASAPKNS